MGLGVSGWEYGKSEAEEGGRKEEGSSGGSEVGRGKMSGGGGEEEASIEAATKITFNSF